MLFSWKLAYKNLVEIISHEDPLNVSVCSAESLDHDELNPKNQRSNLEPLLSSKLSEKTDSTFGLKRKFNIIVTIIVATLLINSFLVIFHQFDTTGSEETLRY